MYKHSGSPPADRPGDGDVHLDRIERIKTHIAVLVNQQGHQDLLRSQLIKQTKQT